MSLSTVQKKLIAAVSTLLMAFAATSVHAGSGTGKIIYFVSFKIGSLEAIAVRLDAQTVESCATANRFVLTADDARFRTISAMLIGAYYSDNPVRLHGTTSCTLYAGSEDLAYACLGSDPC